jgi:sporulation protein YlmC with PRC-barrel domain
MDELHVELLLGRHVVDAAGESVGHIEELRAEDHGGDLVVLEFHTGVRGVAEGLSAARIVVHLLRTLRGKKMKGYAIRWDQLDFSDPAHPRALCLKSELRPLQ